jgi:acetyl-CoA carboxylase biotin carboxylase subunit
VERECSIQRRHQKLIEETPSPAVGPELRAQLTGAAEAIGRSAGYTSAGTIEFLVDRSGAFFFLEMNTRLQVEHPITEAVTGLDLVRAQIEISQGRRMDAILTDGKVETTHLARGHAIEVRVYAEDAENGFLPSPGLITHLRAPAGPGIRDDSGAFEGWVVPTAYDPLVSKVIAWAPDRQGAIARMVRALSEYDLRGIATTIGFCRELIESGAFAAAEFDTTSVDRMMEQRSQQVPPRDDEREEIAAIAAALWEVARLKSSPTGMPVSTATSTTAVATSTTAVGRGFSRADSLWTQRARIEGLR